MKSVGYAILLVLGSAGWAEAGLVQITSPSQLGAYDTVDWATFGSVPSTVFTYAAEPSGPLTVHINTASGELAIEPGSDVGGFLPTDTLLSQLPGNLSDTILVGFSTPVMGVGTQIESLLSGPFIGQMDVFDSGGNSLGEITVNASTTTAQDGSAPFIGAISTSANIDYVIFSVNNGNPSFPKAGDVAINGLDFSVPEPLTLSIFGAGLAGAVAMRRRKTAKA
ncbi:MAG TPA: PEP-CTERM sorting domain-containing protein [Rhizomicrobium sp.]|jgi:hypothetical protein